MSLRAITSYLERRGAPYIILTHRAAMTAQQTAQQAHVSGHRLAKTVMMMIEGDLAMVVLPTSHKVNLERLREELGCENARLATEGEFEARLPDWELGAIPPFGNLCDMPVYVSHDLADQEDIYFAAGSRTELICMPWADYEALVKPRLLQTV